MKLPEWKMKSASRRFNNRQQKLFFLQSEKNWNQKSTTQYNGVIPLQNVINFFWPLERVPAVGGWLQWRKLSPRCTTSSNRIEKKSIQKFFENLTYVISIQNFTNFTRGIIYIRKFEFNDKFKGYLKYEYLLNKLQKAKKTV